MRTSHPEYFFIISPPADILNEINRMKRLVRTSIGRPFDSECSIGHISLHKNDDIHGEEALHEIGNRLSALAPFSVQIKDFNVFRNSKTIFLDIVHQGFIYDVFETITQLRYQGVPHMTLAKNLRKEDFEKAWRTLQGIQYNNRFTCDRVKVLKRSHRRWLHHTELYFGKKIITQGPREIMAPATN
jgi:2'-5' RNA ligase